MATVAKLVLIDSDERYLLMYRTDHPTFGNDADLPGGTLEDGETPIQTMLREVYEEAGITVDEADVVEVYHGTEYSRHDTEYVLYRSRCAQRPEVVMSWEHSSYEWLPLDEFLTRAKSANDTFMHMVSDVLSPSLDEPV